MTDIHGHTSNCNQTITVTDDEAPAITCPSTINQTADLGKCYATITTLGTPVTSDNCGVQSVTNNAPANHQYGVGTNTVTWTVTDIHGHTSNCNQTITVTDDEAPAITCPSTINQTADLGKCYATITTLGTPVTSDNCGVQSVTNNAPANHQYGVGTNTVTWTVTDIHGHTSNCNQTITVTDDEAPAITCPSTINQTADLGKCYATITTLGTPVTSDNCGVQSVTNNAPANHQYGVGTNTVTWTVTDIHGHTSNCNQTITVTDDEAPAITCPSTINQTADAGKCYVTITTLGTPVTSDNCGVQSVTNNAPANHQYGVGTNTVTWTVTDIHGHTSNCNQTITVTDDEAPAITCPSTINQTADLGKCYATITTLGTPVTSDNCGVQSVTNNAPANHQYGVGTNTVTWTVTDIHGHTSNCNQTITVTDDEAPAITCPINNQPDGRFGKMLCNDHNPWHPGHQ